MPHYESGKFAGNGEKTGITLNHYLYLYAGSKPATAATNIKRTTVLVAPDGRAPFLFRRHPHHEGKAVGPDESDCPVT